MATINLPVEADCRISTNLSTVTTNYESSFPNYWHTNPTYEWRTVLRPSFGTLPVDAIISAVTLYVYIEGGDSGAGNHRFYRLRRIFVENEVTGARARVGTNWTTYGAENTSSDRYSTQSAVLYVPDNTKQWRSCAFNVSEFNALRSSNTGYILKATDGSGERYFRSRTYSGYSPYFTVIYDLPPTAKKRRIIWFG